MKIIRDDYRDEYIVETDADLNEVIHGFLNKKFININFGTEYMDAIEGDYKDRFYDWNARILQGVFFRLRDSVDGRIIYKILKKNGFIH